VPTLPKYIKKNSTINLFYGYYKNYILFYMNKNAKFRNTRVDKMKFCNFVKPIKDEK